MDNCSDPERLVAATKAEARKEKSLEALGNAANSAVR